VTTLLFLSFSILIAAGCHAFIKSYFLASIVAASAVVAGIQVASYIELGHIDPYWQIASVTGFFMASVIALLVGVPFRIMRAVEHDDR